MTVRLFTIAIPTYNRASMLGAAVESALDQIDGDFELLIVDNASTDGTRDVCEGLHDPRIRTIRNPSTVSMYANHNICIANALAPWVVFLHSDDRLRSDALAQLRRRIEHGRCDVVFPGKALHGGHLAQGDLILSGRRSIPSLLRWPAGTPSGAAYRRSLIEEIRFSERGVVSDFQLLAEVLLRDGSVAISSDNTVDIGEGEFQYSHEWHASGAFITDLAEAIGRIVSLPGVLPDIESEIEIWSDAEIAFLLLMLSHAGERGAINRLEGRLGARTDYKNSRAYRHVVLYKALGRPGLRILFRAAKAIRAASS